MEQQASPNVTPLYRQMDQSLNLDEFQDLCLELDLDIENLAGGTKKAKIRSLVLEMQRQVRLDELITTMEVARPNYNWQTPTVITPQEAKTRQQFLKNVQATWIEGFLHQSLSQAIAIELNLNYQHDATTRKMLHVPGQEDRPVEKPIVEVFEDYGRSLLILGAPGSGKTITLLQLAEELVHEAKTNPGEKAPVILNLSSWAMERQSFTDWLVEEIFLQYGLSRELTRRWIEKNRFLYLLDGLDEVANEVRDPCVEAINTFRAEAHYPIEIVVCSRINDYGVLNNRLNVGIAVTIQPLNEEQINAYLNRDDLELQAVQAALTYDPDLQELTQFPLMLNIMTLAYRGTTKEILLTSFGSVEKRREHLFSTYVAEMFKRRLLMSDRYDTSQAQRWLANLAYGMQEHSQSIFYIERLQPTWLRSTHLLKRHSIFSALIGGLIFGLFVGLIFGLIFGLKAGLIIGSIVGLIVGLIGGLIFGLFGKDFELVEELQWKTPPKTISLISAKVLRGVLIVGLIVGIAIGLIAGLIVGMRIGLSDGLIFGLIVGLLGGLLGVLVGVLIGMLLDVIQKREISQRFLPNQVAKPSRTGTCRTTCRVTGRQPRCSEIAPGRPMLPRAWPSARATTVT